MSVIRLLGGWEGKSWTWRQPGLHSKAETSLICEKLSLKKQKQLDIVVHTFNSSTLEAEADLCEFQDS